MKRAVIALSLVATAAALVACSAILGLQEPVLDDTIGGDAQKSDVVVGTDAGDGGAQLLVQGQTNTIALDDSFVYYAVGLDSLVGRVGKDGTNQLDIASGPGVTYAGPYDVKLDATDVFWATGSSLHECAKAGCLNSPTHIIDENAPDAGSYDIQAYVPDDGSKVYFGVKDPNNDQVSLYWVPKNVANGPVTLFVDEPTFAVCPTLDDLQYAAGYVYFLCDEGPIGRVSTTTAAVEVFTIPATPPSLSRMVLAGSAIFYTQFTAAGSVFTLPMIDDAGSTPIVLQQPYPDAIDVDQQYAYWTNFGATGLGDGEIARCKLGQCSSTITPLVSNLTGIADVKVDTTSIYYSLPQNGNLPTSGIYKMVKP